MKSLEAAIFRSNKSGIPYCIVQAKNGQWMCERLEFVEGPIGKVIYANRKKEVVRPSEVCSPRFNIILK